MYVFLSAGKTRRGCVDYKWFQSLEFVMELTMLRIIFCIALSFISFSVKAEPLVRPPDSILGIGASPCSDYVDTYEDMQRVNRKEVSDVGAIVGIYGAYGDFTGTFGGFLASSMMTNGDREVPTRDSDHAMNLIYKICKDNPSTRYIDVVYVMSHTLFGRNVPWGEGANVD